MNKKTFIKISAFFLLVFMTAPILAYSALEYSYPETPGTHQTITSNSGLGEIVKYIATWIIAIGAIVVFGSLVYAGIQYLSSVGDPGKMKGAMDRIFNSFLGLIILLGSFLVLYTINPQLTIMEVKKTPIEKSELAAVKLNATPPANVAEAVAQQQSNKEKTVELIKKGVGKLTNIFGKLKAKRGPQSRLDNKSFSLAPAINSSLFSFFDFLKIPDISAASGPIYEVNFKDFPLGSFVYLPDEDGNVPQIKIMLYPFEDYKTSDTINGIKYTYKPIELLPGEPVPSIFFKTRLDGKKIIDEDDKELVVGASDHYFFGTGSDFSFPSPSSADGKYILAPPLSFRIIGIGPGVYLYDENNDQVYFYHSEINFKGTDSLDSIDFDDRAMKIEMKNEANDYLAILFEDSGFENQFRIFFEQKQRSFKKTPLSTTYDNKALGNIKLFDPAGSPTQKNAFIKINGTQAAIDEFGKVKNPSSLFLTEIDDNISACQEVRICNGPEFAGDCIVYLQEGKDIDWQAEKENVGLVKMLMPLYLPENIPNKIGVSYQIKGDDGIMKTENRNAEFEDNIYSIKITGRCLVAMFDRKINLKSDSSFDSWDSGGPGSNSELFELSIMDLNPYNITSCRPLKGIGFWTDQSCASSISVFPIKSFESKGKNSSGASRSF